MRTSAVSAVTHAYNQAGEGAEPEGKSPDEPIQGRGNDHD